MGAMFGPRPGSMKFECTRGMCVWSPVGQASSATAPNQVLGRHGNPFQV